MAYLHIKNLYACQDILLFKECYAMEKIHGTSAHISFKLIDVIPLSDAEKPLDATVGFFSGEQYDKFVQLFNAEELKRKFLTMDINQMTIFGEAYGGRCQGMSKTYGPDLKFIAFDVRMGEYCWLNVPDAESVARAFGLDFVAYSQVPTTLEALDIEKNKDSVQAVRNGMGKGHMREGIVLRPLIELRKNNGERIIAKHKRDEFRETETVRKVSPDKLKVMSDAKKIATEYVTEMRLGHVLGRLPQGINVEQTRDVIFAMLEDVEREAAGEIVMNIDTKKAISSRTADMFKKRLKDSLRDQ
jgi:hypothetical protein